MSSMIKKKGALSFKPKAPQARRPAGAPSSQPSLTPRPSVDRQSQTPAPSVRPTPAFSPPPHSDSSHPHAPSQVSSGLEPPTNLRQTRSQNEDQSSAVQETSGPDFSVRQDGLSSATAAQEAPRTTTIGSLSQSQSQLDPTPTTAQLPTARHAASVASMQSAATEESRSPLLTPLVEESARINAVSSTGTTSISDDADIPINTIVRRGGAPTLTDDQNVPVARDHAQSPPPDPMDLSTMGAGESAQISQLVPVAPLNIDGTSGATIVTPVTGKKRRPNKRRRLDDDYPLDVRPTIEVQIHKRSRAPKALMPKKPRKKKEGGVKTRKKRGQTPEDAEEQEIDHATVKMSELCKDPRIGRKFSKHAEIKQREIDKKVKAKLMREHPELLAIEEGHTDANATEVAVAEEFSNGTQLRLVNGQMVMDERTLILDRHAQAAANADVMEVIEENEFTKITTSGSYMKREKASVWNFEEYEKFYNGIRMFGTDFEMIAQMFPNRNRRQIKLKFNKEEREYPDKIKHALMGEKVQIDFDAFVSHTGKEFQSLEEFNAEYEAVERDNRAQEQAAKDNETAAQRSKRAQIHGTDDGAPAAGTESAKENETSGGGTLQDGKASAASKSKKKGAAKRKKPQHSIHGGGEAIEIVGDA